MHSADKERSQTTLRSLVTHTLASLLSLEFVLGFSFSFFLFFLFLFLEDVFFPNTRTQLNLHNFQLVAYTHAIPRWVVEGSQHDSLVLFQVVSQCLHCRQVGFLPAENIKSAASFTMHRAELQRQFQVSIASGFRNLVNKFILSA